MVEMLVFSAKWCGPCRAMKPNVDAVEQAYEGKVKVTRVDIDENQELTAKYGVRAVPTVVVQLGDEEKARRVGGQSKSVLETMVKDLL